MNKLRIIIFALLCLTWVSCKKTTTQQVGNTNQKDTIPPLPPIGESKIGHKMEINKRCDMALIPVKVDVSGGYVVSVKNHLNQEVFSGTNPVSFSSNIFQNIPYVGFNDNIPRQFKVKTTSVAGYSVELTFTDQCAPATGGALQRLTFNYTPEPEENLQNGNYDPRQKFGTYAWKGRQPLIWDMGFETVGKALNVNVKLAQLGFSQVTHRSYKIGFGNLFEQLPRAEMATLYYSHNIIDPYDFPNKTVLKYHKDPTSLCTGNGGGLYQDPVDAQNPLDLQTATINANLFDVGSNSKVYSLDYETVNLFHSDADILAKRPCLGAGIMRKASDGGTDAFWKDIPDSQFPFIYRKFKADWWKNFFEQLSIRNSGKDLLGWYNVGAKRGVVTTGTFLPLENQQLNGVQDPNWSVVGYNGKALRDIVDFAGGFDVYCGEYALPIDPTDSKILVDLLGQIQANFVADPQKPSQIYVKPFRENVTGQQVDRPDMNGTGENSTGTVGNCTTCFYKEGSRQVAAGMVLIPLFTNSSAWFWGTIHNKKLAKTFDYIFEATKVASLIPFTLDGTEEYFIPEYKNGANWIGDSQSRTNSLNIQNPNRYTAWTVIQNQSPTVGFPILLGIKKGNQLAIFSTIIGGTDAGNKTFEFRVKRADGSYFTKTVTCANRDYYVWHVQDINAN